MKSISPLQSILAIAVFVSSAAAFETEIECNTSIQDTGVPQSGFSSGSGGSAGAAMDDLAQDASSVECGPCTGSGCELGSASPSSQNVDPGQGGSIAVGVNKQTGLSVIGVEWGPGGSFRVTCSPCQ